MVTCSSSSMAIDDSFKRPGAVPFKWEIRPGVPKIQCQQKQQEKQLRLSPPTLPSPSPPFNPRRRLSPSPSPQHKLKPSSGTGGFIFVPPLEPRSRSFRSVPPNQSERWRFDQPARVRTECVSPGCFPSPLLLRKGCKRASVPTPERDYRSDADTLARRSVSSRRSLSPFRDSPTSSSFSYSSYQSSPRLAGDAEWAGFGLF